MFKRLLDFIVFSNIYIAIAAVCMFWTTQLLYSGSCGLSNVVYLIFFATLFTYNLLRLLGLNKDNLNHGGIFMSWIGRHKLVVQIITILSGVISAYYFFKIPFNLQLLFGISGVLSMAYAFPYNPVNNSFFNLRGVGISKTFIVALVWMISTSLVPCLMAEIYSLESITLLALSRFLFILGITIPFDIRDMKYDLEDNLTTIAQKIGVEKTRKLAYGILLGFLVVTLGYFVSPYPTSGTFDLLGMHTSTIAILFFFAIMVSTAIALKLISKLTEKSDEYQYTFLLDGTMILQYALIYASWQIYLVSI